MTTEPQQPMDPMQKLAEIKQVAKDSENLLVFSLTKVVEQLMQTVTQVTQAVEQLKRAQTLTPLSVQIREPAYTEGQLVRSIMFPEPIEVRNGDTVVLRSSMKDGSASIRPEAEINNDIPVSNIDWNMVNEMLAATHTPSPTSPPATAPAQPAQYPQANPTAAQEGQYIATTEAQAADLMARRHWAPVGPPEVVTDPETPVQRLNDEFHMTVRLYVTLDKPVHLLDITTRTKIKDMIAGRAHSMQAVAHVEVL